MVDLSVFGKVEKPMIAIIIMLIAVLAIFNWQVAILCIIVAAAMLGFISHRAKKRRNDLESYFRTMTFNVNQTTHYALQNLPIAIVIIDNKMNVCWSNSVFNDWLGGDLEKTQRLSVLSTTWRIDKLWGKSGFFTEELDGKTYRIVHKYIPPLETEEEEPVNRRQKQGFMALYYDDITEMEAIKREALAALPVLGFIEIDNIDDITKGRNDIDYTNMWVQVNNVIVEEFAQLNGFVRSYKDNSYIVCISREALQTMIDRNFQILDKVREISTPERLPITLSVGMATEDATFKDQAERARAGLDLALGRGGDQVALFTGEDVQFYGGKTTGAEKNTRVRARVVAQAIRELIIDADNVIIMGHQREDYDSIGGAIGMAVMARHDNDKVNVVLSNQTNAVDNLVQMLAKDENMKNLVITPEQAEAMTNENTLVFVVDVHRPDMVAAPNVLSKTQRRVVIDHHRRSPDFIEKPLLTYLESTSSSTSELVTELIQYYADNIELNEIEASALYAGIAVDTKNFIVSTGFRTFDAASYLRRSGADLEIVRSLFKETFETAQRRAEIISMAKLEGTLAYAECPKNTPNASVVCAQTADWLITVEGVEASFVFYYRGEDNGIGVSARSQGSYNVQIIMEKLGGGGHRTVAGAQLNMSMEEAQAAVRAAAQEYVQKQVSIEEEK